MADNDPIRNMIREEIDRARSEGRSINPDELAAAVQARVDTYSEDETLALLAEVIENAVASGEESPGDMAAKLFYPKEDGS